MKVEPVDGWTFARLEDGTIRIEVIDPKDDSRWLAMILTAAEWDALARAMSA